MRLMNPAEVTGLAYDAPSNRLAVCHRGGIMQVFRLGGNLPKEILSMNLGGDIVPKAVAFGQLHGDERDVLVFSLYGGDM